MATATPSTMKTPTLHIAGGKLNQLIGTKLYPKRFDTLHRRVDVDNDHAAFPSSHEGANTSSSLSSGDPEIAFAMRLTRVVQTPARPDTPASFCFKLEHVDRLAKHTCLPLLRWLTSPSFRG